MMITALDLRPVRRARPRRFLAELEHPGQAFANVTPNWFAGVMGTGIVATAAATLPQQFPGLRAAATVVWGIAALLLATLVGATAVHWRRYRTTALQHHHDPVMAHFYGAPAMALLTVGSGTLLLGPEVIGLRAAIDVDWVLWFAGTILGLITAIVIPYLQFTRHQGRPDLAFGGWLMPVVPPMVSASAGALLVPHAPAGQVRLTLVLCCYAMFGLSLLASVIITTMIWHRLAVHGPGPARLVPTVWIALGWMGQSITAVNLLGGVAGSVLPAPYAGALRALGVVYGVPVWGFAFAWTGLAAAITIRTARRHLPFSLTWWSFTFPVGTLVTGTTGLALHTGADLFRVGAAVIYAGLVLAWAAVATRTARDTFTGALLRPAAAVA